MSASPLVKESFSENPLLLLQRLIRYDTTNPPGNEAECIGFLDSLLRDSGVETTLLAKTPQRPNLIARLKGQGSAPPLLLYGHVDVVTTANQVWQHPPFDGEVVDGFVWGRGALDMKGGVAMMVAAILRAKADQVPRPADVVLAIVSDEEAAGDYGARFLVESHPDLFRGIRHALGEFGGFTFFLGKRRFYPIMVAEKQICWMRATVRGQGGHGSLPVRGEAMAKLAHAILRLERHNLPVHITPAARLMFQSLGSAAPVPTGVILQSLLNPRLTNGILALLGSQGRTFGPLFRNTVSATILHGSDKVNVIPSQVSFELDGRLLPGSRPEDMVAELRPILGAEVELEVLRHDPGPAEPEMSLFDTLAGILREADPEGAPVPLLLSAVTDARYFSRLGIQTYGFLPMQLPQGFDFSRTIHGADERLPVDAVEFGTSAILKAIHRYRPDRAV